MPPFWHNWDDRGRIAGDAEHPNRTRLPLYILKRAQALRKGTTSSVMVAGKAEGSFWPDGSTSPGNYKCLFVDPCFFFSVRMTL
jgi:hypothetical protein